MFENAALTYDQDFTFSNIGKLLRQHVWNYLDLVIKPGSELNILELNCGTGEDAIQFAKKGHKVVAIDLSTEMVNITRKKINEYNVHDSVNVLVGDSRKLEACNFLSNFDLVFSNFGGLNCLNKTELKKLSGDIFQLLKPNGRFVSVVMPKFCVWESLYFLSKFDTQKVFRRNTRGSLKVNVADEDVETWYYSPKHFSQIFQDHFSKITTRPIGFTLPPSYMEERVGKSKNVMSFLNHSEKAFGAVELLAGVSDHFLMDLQKKKRV